MTQRQHTTIWVLFGLGIVIMFTSIFFTKETTYTVSGIVCAKYHRYNGGGYTVVLDTVEHSVPFSEFCSAREGEYAEIAITEQDNTVFLSIVALGGLIALVPMMYGLTKSL